MVEHFSPEMYMTQVQGDKPDKHISHKKHPERVPDSAGGVVGFDTTQVLRGPKHEVAGMTLEEAAAQAVSVEDASLDTETKFAATDAGLVGMAEALKSIPHAIFASTAKYLHGKEHSIPELLARTPGDFDAVVFSEADLKLARNRLSNIPGVKLAHDGEFTTLPGGAQVLSGDLYVSVPTPNGEQVVAYPFEIFYNSVIVTKDITSGRVPMRGLSVLNRGALEKQYLKNLELESRIQQNVDAVATFLRTDEVQAEVKAFLAAESTTTPVWLEKLALSPDELRDFYVLEDKRHAHMQSGGDESANARALRDIESKQTKLLSGMKTKIPSRLKSLAELSVLPDDTHGDGEEVQTIRTQM